jgi:hypothetical protein
MTPPGHLNPHGTMPNKGWQDDRTPWWCSRCHTIQYGLYAWMHGGCPSPRHGKRCGTILMRLKP